ncbi:hypothetical protein [Prauserella muralis]|uniref:Uncharacterized protein n=1 Tax=Prauserella muralis TaxID=588067 RepID=A0A2V4BAV7_9PSEU|nr:hypothetical protein [Prauserella muralis]PXY31189.1 hypothetical protein BAY60_01905 [Prauserella muralis]TWE14514.1 hypothetical protein FHX69_6665 [Prauserella muralis]
MANGDGTQAPEPPQSFADPLAGLVSSGRPEFSVKTDRDQYSDIEIARPVEPDSEMVRGMVDAAMAGERAQAPAPRTAGDDQVGEDGQDDVDANATTGELPAVDAEPKQSEQPAGLYPQQQRAWPARSALLPPMLRRRQLGAQRAEKKDDLAERRDRVPWRKPSSGSAGLAVALVLLLAFGLVAVQFVTSFVESITGLFE